MASDQEIRAARVRRVSLDLPSGVSIERIVLMQDTDSNQSDCDDPQRLEIVVEDAGGGSFLVLKTARWACDEIDVATLTAALSVLCKETAP